MIPDHTPLPINDIITPRLVLRLMDGEDLSALLAGQITDVEQRLGVRIPGEVLDHASSFRFGLEQLEADSLYRPWSSRAVILPGENRMIGHVRFHTRPDPDYLQKYVRNAVEFGYRIFGNDRGKGYASEAVGAIMDWARDTHGISQFVLSISPDNAPSLAIARKFGFVKVGEEMDDVDGMEHVYLRVAD